MQNGKTPKPWASFVRWHIKDPLTFLIKLVQSRTSENDFAYYSRLQDSVPLILNNQFLEEESL